MATIKAIENRSIHQIQSGQVIVGLSSVVKELVENSLDAGATSIEVRFKNHGLDAIEVQDNGKGIAPEDFETVALKHHTSKLSSFEDLDSLDTFGFRGEALSSLCALSKFHIQTARTEDGAAGKKLEFEVSGRFKGSSVTAAQKGTTVYVEELFYNLPVRRKELEKNIKREYGKVISLLHAYACIGVGVRLSVSNQIPKGKKTTVLSTNSNPTVKENIANVFGAKMLPGLLELNLNLELQPSEETGTQDRRSRSLWAANHSMPVKIEGHISKPVFGEGRQAPDKQIFFVNSRPCTLPQVSKVFNEVYKSFNVSQSPFVFANLILDTTAYDVNVSPDKRSIMLHDQGILLENLKTALTGLFERTVHTVPQSVLPFHKSMPFKPQTTLLKSATEGSESGAMPADDDRSVDGNDGEEIFKPNLARPTAQLIHDWVGRSSKLREEKLSTKSRPKSVGIDSERVSNGSNNAYLSASEEDIEADGNTMKASTTSDDETASDSGPSKHPTNGRANGESSGHGVNDQISQDSTSHRETSTPPQTRLLLQDEKDLDSENPHIQSDDDQDDFERNENCSESLEKDRDSKDAEIPYLLEQNIPSTAQGAQKAIPGSVQNAFDRMRPRRMPLQVAEITVGNQTSRTIVGTSPPFKKRRIHEVRNPEADAPMIAGGIHQKFAAPGSQSDIRDSELFSTRSEDITLFGQGSNDYDSADDPSQDQVEGEIMPNESVLPSDDFGVLKNAINTQGELDDEYVDATENRIREEQKIARLIKDAEEAAARPTGENIKRASQALKNNVNRKDSTLQLMLPLETSVAHIEQQLVLLRSNIEAYNCKLGESSNDDNAIIKDDIDSTEAESRLSLTVTKSDFAQMRIVGQFNLGFILALRQASALDHEDDLFIIDQHAADEKYNYERLYRTVTIKSQRLVRSKLLELNAFEEEIVLNHSEALKANGFEIEIESSSADDDQNDEDESASRQYRLLTLPMSKEKTFDLSDLEELLHLISETSAGGTYIPRPQKVQKMLAMRACRSSIMVGKTLTGKQMEKVIGNMGEMEKPWNCPHGRPTMRHLAGLNAWNEWREGDVIDSDKEIVGDAQLGSKTGWAAWLGTQK